MRSREVSEKSQKGVYSLEIAKIKNKQFEDRINLYYAKQLMYKEKYLKLDTDEETKAECIKGIDETNRKILDTKTEFIAYCADFMRNLPSTIKVNKTQYEFIRCANAAIQIQERYSSIDEWIQQVLALIPSAIVDGALAMINEGIDMYNERVAIYNKNHPEKPKKLKELLDEKTVGRMPLEVITPPVLKRVFEAIAANGKPI